MSDDSTEELLVRALKHERALMYGAATDVVETQFGSIVLNTDHLNALSHNFAFVDRRVEPGHLLSETDRVFDGVGIAFRVLSITERSLADALAPALQKAEFKQSSDLLMALLDTPERLPSIEAELVTFEEARPGIEGFWRHTGKSEEGARRLASRATTYKQCCDLTYAAVRKGGALVSRCALYRKGTTAQIDEVTTDLPFEGKGYGTAVVATAAEHARSQSCDLIFLRTDAGEWPQHLYRRLGFRDIGRTYWFERDEN